MKYLKALVIGLSLTILDLAAWEFYKLLGFLILWSWFFLVALAIMIDEK